MKKVLLSTAAIAVSAMVATPAAAQVQLEIGGYFKGYGAYVDQDEAANTDINEFDLIRSTEVHFGGETTLDNGLTVGAHLEVEADGNDAFNVDESYVYFSGGWGRVNAGSEDGASYLLQVAAPSADSNIDGIRQFVQPVNATALLGTGNVPASTVLGTDNSGGIDYDADASGKSDKITYLTPLVAGFQGGASFTPDTTDAATSSVELANDNAIGATYEAALRYEGEFEGVGVTAGAGYSFGEQGTTAAANDDREVYNVGLDLDFGPIGVGAVYVEDNVGRDGAGTDDEETFVVGVDYTTGPFKLGASYYDQENTGGTDGSEITRYSGGVTYTYGPGMTFRGSIGYLEADATGSSEQDATYVTLGTQINF